MNNVTRLIALITLLMLLSSCGLIKTKYADWRYEDKELKNDISQPDFKNDKYLFELADRFGLMAHFATVAYRDDLLVKIKKYKKTGELEHEEITSNNYDSACNYLNSDRPPPIYGMPPIYPQNSKNHESNWSRWKGSNKVESEPCYNQKGLFYETYIYTKNTIIQEAVIAFRGTENNSSQLWYDWKANLANFFGFEPQQYEIASKNILNVITALTHSNPDIKIYATGHSLGGGLAQQTGYLSKDIREVFTFNTSPITNWTNLTLRGAVKNAYPIIHRVYNGGEVLGGIRSVATLFTKARYGRHDIGIQVKPKQLFKGHSMTLLSCHLACLIESNDTLAQENLTLSYTKLSPKHIREHLMKKGGICSGYVDIGKCDLTVSDAK